MENNKETKKTISLLKVIERIVVLAEGSRLSKEFYSKAEPHIKYVASQLRLTKTQVVLFALFLNKTYDDHICLTDIGSYLQIPQITLIRCINHVEALVEKEYLGVKSFMGEKSYYVPSHIINCLRKNERYVPRNYSGLSASDLFLEMDSLFRKRADREMDYKTLVKKITNMLDANKQLEFVQKLDKYGLSEDEKMLLLLFCVQYWKNYDDEIEYQNYNFLYDTRRKMIEARNSLMSGKHRLHELSLIEFNTDDGMADRESVRLTLKTKCELLQELNLSLMMRKRKDDSLLHANEITPKNLFFSERTHEQVDKLKNILEQNRYQEVKERMKEYGFHSGFTCLFYGMPGTGKTETVYQLARQTGRDIMKVEISQVKDKWVGESEKNIKAIFESYRKKVKENEVTPILLFNEADGIFGIRNDKATRSVDKMENSIQNIILQEMEDLDGILIATTNLVQNLDDAFERRFLYKIQFPTPNSEARIGIWKSHVPELNDHDAAILADKYDFSGGLIENVARRHLVDIILDGKQECTLKKLTELCEQEKIEKKASKKVGF